MLKNKKILLTGGCGFIGNNFTQLLIQNNISDLLIIDKISYASNKEFHIKNNIHIVENDIISLEAFNSLINFKPDIIINMAAESSVDKSIHTPDIFLKSNVFGTTNLMNAALKLKNTPIWMQISTDEVYGDNLAGWSNENDPRKTSSPYSASKASAEMFVESYGRTYNLPYVITRTSNNFGPYQHIEKFIPRIIYNILNYKKIPIYGNGLQERDWIYVMDNCLALLKILNNINLCLNNVFNIGEDKTYTNIDIVKRICYIMDKEPGEFIEYVTDRPGHDFRYAIKTDKIKNILNWNPVTDFEGGLLKTIEWYKDEYNTVKIS